MPSVTLPKYRGYAIHVDGTVRRLRDGAIVAPRTVLDLWVRGRAVTVEHAWLYALAFGHDLKADVAVPADAEALASLEKEVQALTRENKDLHARLMAVGIF